jgi:hypothetical protein
MKIRGFCSYVLYRASRQYLCMADTIFEYLKYLLKKNIYQFQKIPGVKQVVEKIYRCRFFLKRCPKFIFFLT